MQMPAQADLQQINVNLLSAEMLAPIIRLEEPFG